MPISSKTNRGAVMARLALIAAASAAMAGCSADTGRFAEAPQAGGPPEYTGSLGAAPVGRVDSSALPPPSQSGYGAPQSGYGAAQPGYGAPQAGYGASQPGYGYGAPNASASYASPTNAGAAQPLYGAPNYSGVGAQAATQMSAPGTHVVEAGETLGSVARRYNVDPAQLGAANNIAPGKTVRTGQALVIPPAGSFTPMATATAATTAATATATAKAAPVVAAAKSATAAGTASGAKAVTAATAARSASPAMGTLGTMPANPAVAAARPVAPTPIQPSRIASAPAPAPVASAPAPKPADARVADAKSAKAAAKPAAEAKVETAAKVTPVADADDAPRGTGSGPQFRAPVRGRVIASFGPKPGGTRNDGVNFAVPEGTGVRAAEDGVVAYSGSELKGYGNLVLIKHSDGYVTAYAHASELNVKKGDTVRRGQIIAKAGQSGDVSSPQLHFEIRKGSTAVDPSRYVAGL